MDAGIGTHMDAPAHIVPGGLSIGEIPCEQLIAPAAIIDCDDELSLKEVREYESIYGPIPPHALVIAFTGWSRFWSDPIAYRNELRFPTFSAEAAEFLLTEREIVGIAIDTLSPDRFDSTFPVHRLVLGAGKYIIENVGDCSSMPRQGGYVACLPLRCRGATESPIRMVGFLTKSLESM